MESIKLLHVEDNEGDALIVREMLRYVKNLHVELSHVATLADAKDQLSSSNYDILLLDLGLPDSFQFSALEEILETKPSQWVIVLTGSEGHEKGIEAVKIGADDYLSKNVITPYSLERPSCSV